MSIKMHLFSYIHIQYNISDSMMENNIWHMTTCIESACVDALDEIDKT